jgi:ADP-ribose pyrophosphatase YjhB (NUDIX family)
MYPTTIYRVVAKAFITNEQGKVLAVKEKGDFWSLPGGGVDHGETAQAAIKREMVEELGAHDVQVGDIAYSTSVYLDRRDMWMTWIVYKATVDSADFAFGDGVTDARFIDIAEIADSNDILEQLIVETYKALS